MAGWYSGYSNRLRVGLFWRVVSGPDSAGKVVVRFDVYVQTDYSYYNYDVSVTASPQASGSRSGTKRLSAGSALHMFTFDEWWTADVGKSRIVTVGVSANSSAAGPVSGTWQVALPARANPTPTPTPVPDKPTVSSTRVSDSQARVDYTVSGTLTGAVVQRQQWSGSGWTAAKQVGKPSGNGRSFTDSTIAKGNAYRYRAAGINITGQGVFSDWSNEVITTPLAPTGVTATLLTLTSARVAWAFQGQGSLSARIERQVDSGSWVQVATLGDWVQSWIDTTIPTSAVSVKYRVRAFATKATSLVSDYSAVSNTLVATAKPNAPTGLAPNGDVVAAGASLTLSWRHNPTDTTSQSAAEVRIRVDGGGWTILTATTVQNLSYTPPAGIVEWQVRTKGLHASWSDWSAVATLTGATAPVVTVLRPEGEITTAILTARWAFDQDQELPQSSWEAQLLTNTGELLEAGSGSGSQTSFEFKRRARNGESLRVRVRAAAGSLQSDWSESLFAAVFREPLPPEIFVIWDEQTGSHTVNYSAQTVLDCEVTLTDDVFTFEILEEV